MRRNKVWAAVLFFWTVLLLIWTSFCWNAWPARAAAELRNAPGKVSAPDVPWIDQWDGFPTGCESVSAVMVLRYFGWELSVEDFVSGYLPLGDAPHMEDGRLVGCDPREKFPGDPREETGWGCYAPVIAGALERWAEDHPSRKFSVEMPEGEPLSALCGDYTDRGIPVLVWATIGMEEPRATASFVLEDTGELFTWNYPLHCLVLVGRDGEGYRFNDPLAGKAVLYPKEQAEQAYDGMGRQAVVLLPDSP